MGPLAGRVAAVGRWVAKERERRERERPPRGGEEEEKLSDPSSTNHTRHATPIMMDFYHFVTEPLEFDVA